METRPRIKYALVLFALLAAALACNAPAGRGSVTLTPASQATYFIDPALLTQAATAIYGSETPAVTLEPGVTPTPTTACDYWAAFLDDVTIPDGTQIKAGTGFDKTWKLWNNGCLDWSEGTQLVFIDGDQMGSVDTAPVPQTAANDTVEVTVHLTAPTTPGHYRGYWQLSTPTGRLFAPSIYVDINVTPGDTPTPTPVWLPFVGTWINQDTSSRIAFIDITEQSNVLIIHLWQTCVPSACDLGPTATAIFDANDGTINATWTHDATTETQQLTILPDGRLQVVGTLDDGSGSVADYTLTFTRKQ